MSMYTCVLPGLFRLWRPRATASGCTLRQLLLLHSSRIAFTITILLDWTHLGLQRHYDHRARSNSWADPGFSALLICCVFLICSLFLLIRDAARLAFSVANPTSSNSLPGRLRDPTLSSDSFRGNHFKNGIICELFNTLSAVENRDASWFCVI